MIGKKRYLLIISSLFLSSLCLFTLPAYGASSNNSSTMCSGYPKDLVNKNVVSLKTGDASSYPSIIQGLPITYDDYMFVFCEAYTTIPENVDNASMTIAISGVSTGETIENNKYTIFKLNGSDDFSYVIDMIGVFHFRTTGNTQTTVFAPVLLKNNQKNVIIKGNNSFDRMGVSIRIRFVASRHPENTYTILPQILATVTSDPLGKSANIIYQGSIIIPSTPTCKVSKSSYNIMMNPISASQLPTIGSKAVGGTTNIEMTCESARVDVHATMTDANDPSATKELLSLEQGSTAKGVAIKLYRNDEVIKLAPASHVYNQSNDQWLFGNKKKGLISVPITAHYYRTGEVTAGKVSALAFINFAYQ